jgi:hypothetical protein
VRLFYFYFYFFFQQWSGNVAARSRLYLNPPGRSSPPAGAVGRLPSRRPAPCQPNNSCGALRCHAGPLVAGLTHGMCSPAPFSFQNQTEWKIILAARSWTSCASRSTSPPCPWPA